MWLYILLIIAMGTIFAVIASNKKKPHLSDQKDTVPKTEEDDIDDIELYIDEVDEHGEPW